MRDRDRDVDRDMDRDMDRDIDGWVVWNIWLASAGGFRGLAAHIRASRQPKSKKPRKNMGGGALRNH